jgi:hypothetical protein
VKNQLRNSKDYTSRKNFDRVNTRYNYQTSNGLLSYLEQEKQFKWQQAQTLNAPTADWTKQAVHLTSQLVKDNSSQANNDYQKTTTPGRQKKQS